MLYVIKIFNNIFYSNNKIKNENISTDDTILQNEQKNDIIKTINNLKILEDVQKTNIKHLSNSLLLDIIWAYNLNQKNLIEILEYDFDKENYDNK
jgi:hypothetical protein